MYVLRGKEGFKVKVYIYCFYDVIQLFKNVKGGVGVWKEPNFNVSTSRMDPKIILHELKSHVTYLKSVS